MDAPVNASIFPHLDEIPQQVRLAGTIEQREYLCDGVLRRWEGPLQDVESPVCLHNGGRLDRQRIGAYPLLTGREALDVLAAGARAWNQGRGVWPTMPIEGRIRAVEQFGWRMKDRRADVVRLLMWEIGKSLADAEKEFDRTVDYIRDTIGALKDLDRVSSRFVIEESVIAQIRRAPLGVVLCMGPFNYPLNETFTTLIPALIMGNPVIVKPPRLGVLLHQPLLEAFRDSFPAGVVGTVYGDGATVVSPLLKSGGIDVLAFIGSSRVADVLKHQHPKPHRLRSVLGLEAKNAAIVLADADLDQAIRECVLGALSYNGQRCTALKMIWVHDAIASEFLSRFSRAVDELEGGMPWQPGVKITPLAEPGKVEAMRALIDDAVAKGARVINRNGGAAEATYMRPAVVYPISPDSRLFREEQFGPVVPVAAFHDIDEPMR
ncbi:MAG TPA: aldehyde dehydrogenase family protein, partial [Vicinamibacterales bacterium]|nr:aldehyde dehydrogenase family protein [Vicinamibacterales bacterium]